MEALADTLDVIACNAAGGGNLPCPECQSDRVYGSRCHGSIEKLKSRFVRFPYRCGACGYRFPLSATDRSRASAGAEDSRPDVDKRRPRRLFHEILLGAMCLAIFVLFLCYVVGPEAFGRDAL